MKNKIKNARLCLGLNQVQFAEKMGITQAHVSRLESGERELKPGGSTDILLDVILKVNNNFFKKDQWKVLKILNKTAEWSGLSKIECHDLYYYIVKYCPTTIIEVYKAYIKVKKYVTFQSFIDFIYESSRRGVSGKEAGEQLRKTLKELLHD